MSGHVLIIDALSNRRIQLHALLDAVCHKLEQAESQSDGLALLQKNAPDVVIIAHDLPGLHLSQFCKKLRSQTETQLITVIVAVPRENHSARVAALTAGASDVIEYGIAAPELHARLRNLTRLQQITEEVQRHIRPNQSLGFAEGQTGFEFGIQVAIICDIESQELPRHLSQLASRADLQVDVISPQKAKRGLDRKVDVIVLFETSNPWQSRDALGALRTHANSRHSGFLYVSGEHSLTIASPLDLGAQDQVSDTVSDEELALRITRLAHRKRAEDQARAELSTLGKKAYTDALTGLNNREYADLFLKKQDRQLAEFPRRYAVLMVDVDHFKQINDTHGHESGDMILAHIASVLRSSVRDGDMLARYGGEEFLIALFDVGPNEARSVAERLRKEVARQPKSLDTGTLVRTTISIGLALSTRTSVISTQEMCRAADKALYRAKSEGRNRLKTATQDDFFQRSSGQVFELKRSSG